jgi:hypothetical protein
MTNLFEQLLGRPLFCRYCGKRCEGDFRTEPQPGGFPAASCDKCNREHAEADPSHGRAVGGVHVNVGRIDLQHSARRCVTSRPRGDHRQVASYVARLPDVTESRSMVYASKAGNLATRKQVCSLTH